ncbi:hypothetical protein STRAU_5594 [Streptomyces aurantiacus JA 4570]|uniref:Uncharacterized protein n=2 Tax=Streptomyces aurantiacus TaxID=47760 RepID=S3ZDZ0_9ACTN|nr:hypothetical protein STRAU_5594 [Streptomyces aurantiacus JA 4570]
MVGVAAPTATAAESEACAWTPATLPLPAGAVTGAVSAADGSGGYAGTTTDGSNYGKDNHAVVWKNGKLTDYGYLVDPNYVKGVEIDAVNDAGTVVGIARRKDGYYNAVRSRNGKIERLPEPAGAYVSSAKGINEKGDVVGNVGMVVDNILRFHPVIWPADQPGKVVALTGLPNASATAHGIDQDGTVLLAAESGNVRAPYLWKDGTARALPLPDGAQNVVTRGISNGRVVAEVTTYSPSYALRGVLWDRDGQPRVLPRNEGIRGINRNGQILGRTDTSGTQEYGVWQLTTLGSTLKQASDLGFDLAATSGDGSVAGRSWKIPDGRITPTVWNCR